jgi:hypothetical protein
MATLTNAQLQKIADEIFVLRDRSTTKLPVPTPSGSAAFNAALDPLRTRTEFANAGIGIIDFTNDANNPDVWLHNETTPFRIGSASKIGMLLAAVQLRLDVRSILDLSPAIISTAAEFEKAFRDPRLWRMGSSPRSEVAKIAETPPLFADIFNFAPPGSDPIDFDGPDPNGRRDAALAPVASVQDPIVDALPIQPTAANPDLPQELTWPELSKFSFSERLWLTGCLSDNVSATACVTQIGQPYIKAVLRAYGLFDRSKGMHLFPSYGFGNVPRSNPAPAPPPPRRLLPPEAITVKDLNVRTGGLIDQQSWVPGSALALTAYMLALMGNRFANTGPLNFLVGGGPACETIRRNMADNGTHQVVSFLVSSGVEADPKNVVTKQIHKIGILRKGEANTNTICEFVYLETKQNPKPATGRNEMKYAVIAAGLMSDRRGTTGSFAATKSAALGAFVHNALLSL